MILCVTAERLIFKKITSLTGHLHLWSNEQNFKCNTVFIANFD